MKSLFFTLLASAALFCLSQDVKGQPSEIGANSVVPLKYLLHLQPWFGPNVSIGARYSTSGFVRIHVSVLENTKTVVLNARKISIESSDDISVQTLENTPLGVIFHSFNAEAETLTIYLADEMQAGEEYNVIIWFTSYFSANVPKGLFLSEYKDPDTGIKQEMVSTLMQPNHARSVFPCFDEPHFKANFTAMFSYYYDSTSPADSYKAIYDQDEESSFWFGYYRRVTYAETEPISTNQFFFAIVPAEW